MSDCVNKTKCWVTSGFCRGVNNICVHFEFYVAWNGRFLFTSFARQYVGHVFKGQTAESMIFLILRKYFRVTSTTEYTA